MPRMPPKGDGKSPAATFTAQDASGQTVSLVTWVYLRDYFSLVFEDQPCCPSGEFFSAPCWFLESAGLPPKWAHEEGVIFVGVAPLLKVCPTPLGGGGGTD